LAERLHTILYVDEDRNTSEAVRESLSGVRHRVITAVTMEDALTIVAAVQVDTVIIHFAFFGKGGIDVAQDVRRRRPGVKVIFASCCEEAGREVVPVARLLG
jgi:DNA-binding response OmpR family regulator